MATREEVIISVSIDKKEAQKNAAQLTKEIEGLRSARSELRKELKDLLARENELTDQRGRAQQALLNLEAAGKQNTNEARKLRIEIDGLNDSFNQNQIRVNNVSSELVTNETVIKSNQKELRILNRELLANEGSLDAARAKLSSLKAEIGQFSVDDTTGKLEKLTEQARELNDAISKQEQSYGVFSRNVGNYGNAIRDALGSAIPGANNLTAALATGPAAIAGIVTAVGAGAAKLAEFQQQLEAQRKEIELLTGATGEALNQTNAALSAIVDTTGTGFTENLEAANSVAKSFGEDVFGVTQDIQKGFAAGGNVTGEYLDILSEYGPIFRDLNLQADEFIAITTQSLKSGVFSDSGLATIEEGLLRIREMPQATQDALNAIGLSSVEIQAQIEAGEIEVFDVIQQVSGKLGELPPQSKEVGQAIADIFGGAGEKAGLEYIKTLQDIDLNLDNVVDEAGEFASQQLRLTQANQDLNLLFNQLLGSADGFFTEAKIGATELLVQGIRGLINGVISLSNFFITAYNNLLPIRVGINFLIAGVRTFGDIIQNSFGAIIDSVRGFGRVFQAVISGNFSDLPGIISDEFGKAAQRGKDFGKDIAENYVDAYNNVFEEVDLIEPLSPDGGDFESVNTQYSNAGKKAAQSFADGVGELDLETAINDVVENLDVDAIEIEVNELKLNTEERIRQLSNAISQENLLYQQQRAKGIADEEVHQQRLLELNRERLGLEAALLEEGSAEKIAKLTELAEIEAQIFEGKELRKKEFEDVLRVEREESEAKAAEQRLEREEAQRQRQDAEINAFREVTETITALTRDRTEQEIEQAEQRKEAFKEQNAVYKAAVIAQKAIAAIEVGINLQREIQSYWASASAAGPAAPAIAIPLTVAAVARSVAALANIARFEEGGSLSDGNSGFATGPSHADGGIFATVRGRRLINFEGREFIINQKAAMNNLPLLHDINNYGDKIKFFESGGSIATGIATREISNNVVNNFNITEQIASIFENMPAPVVTVEDINAGLTDVNKVQLKANQ